MYQRALKRPLALALPLALIAVVLVFLPVGAGQANTELDPASEIVLVLEPGTNQLKYGTNPPQQITTSAAQCNVSGAALDGSIMVISSTATDKKGNPVDPAHVGLVDDGFGSNAKGTGNAQSCGLVDSGESISMKLAVGVGSRLIKSIDFDFEGKFGAQAVVVFKHAGVEVGTPAVFDLTDKGSDSGPDSKSGDNYYETASAGLGVLFDEVVITTTAGSVSIEGGADWADPSSRRTVFHLEPALDCGDSVWDGGTEYADNPLTAFWLGPSAKNDPPCAVAVEIVPNPDSVTDPTVTQSVKVAAPEGYPSDYWTNLGVTGIVTIEWDAEVVPTPDDDAVKRTYISSSAGDAVIPWCTELIPIQPSSEPWFYELSIDDFYDGAITSGFDVCLVKQSTENIIFDAPDDGSSSLVTGTQTTEVFYLYDDPLFVRK